MKIKVIDYLGNEKVYEDVRNVYFTKRGYKIELRDSEWIWRECTKFCTTLDLEGFDHIITEW